MNPRARIFTLALTVTLNLSNPVIAEDDRNLLALNSSVDTPIADKWALVIGISNFQDSSINLKYAAKDAQDFAEFLVSHERFAPDHIKLLVNQDGTRERILDELGDKWLPHAAMPDDLVVIFISTHGSPSSADLAGVNYLVAYNTNKDRLYSTGIPMQELNQLIKERVHARRIVILLDACHSGAAQAGNKALNRPANFDADGIAMGTGQLVICSSEPSQSSWESRRYQNGVFTHNLMEGFLSKGNRTTLGEAFQYMQDKVSEEVIDDRAELQRPVLKSAWEGKDIELAAVPTKPRKAPLSSSTVSVMPQTVDRSGSESSSTNLASKISSQSAKDLVRVVNSQPRLFTAWKAQNKDGSVHGIWQWNKSKQQFTAKWSNGSTDYLKFEKFDDEDVVLSGHNSRGMKVHFAGKRNGNFASGTASVDMKTDTPPLEWEWQASW